MARSSSISLVDRILEGRLRDELTTRRATGESYGTICRWLFVDHEIDLTAETIRQWCLTLDVEPKAATA